MKRLLIVTTLVLIALAVFLWRLPVAAVLAVLPAESSRVLQLHRLDGTVWQGSALLSVAVVPPALPVAWSCRPQLAPVGVYCDLSGAISGVLRVDGLAREIAVGPVSGSVPVRVDAAGVTLAQAPRVSVDITRATATGTRLSLRGSLRAHEATYQLGPSALPLGEINLDCAPGVEADAAASTCTLSNRGGGARLDGRLQLAPGGAHGSVELTPPGGATQRFAF